MSFYFEVIFYYAMCHSIEGEVAHSLEFAYNEIALLKEENRSLKEEKRLK